MSFDSSINTSDNLMGIRAQYEFSEEELKKEIMEGREFTHLDTVIVKGDLDLSTIDLSKVIWPGKLEVCNSFIICNNGTITTLPENLKVCDTMALHDLKKLKTLPTDTNVGGNFELGNCPRISKLPESLKESGWNKFTPKHMRDRGVESSTYKRRGGDIQVTDCPKLENIPNWIFELNAKSRREKRNVRFSNIGITDEAKKNALSKQYQGIKLIIDDKRSVEADSSSNSRERARMLLEALLIN